MVAAKVAVMLVTKDFLASDFISEQELGPLLKMAGGGVVKILWVLVGNCNWKHTLLNELQAAYPPTFPLAQMKAPRRDSACVAVCEQILVDFQA